MMSGTSFFLLRAGGGGGGGACLAKGRSEAGSVCWSRLAGLRLSGLLLKGSPVLYTIRFRVRGFWGVGWGFRFEIRSLDFGSGVWAAQAIGFGV